jgi:hypothetical protein
MTQKATAAPNRRADRRRRPKSWTKATCRKGVLDLGPDFCLGVLDVSETGIRLLISEDLAKDQEVAVTLESPTQTRPIRRVGTVAWSVPTRNSIYCVGIRFDKRLIYNDICKFS